MKPAGRRLVWALGALGLSGCGGSVEAKNYDQACAQASDCVPIYSGALCQLCGGCPNAAINAAAKATYDADAKTIAASCPPRLEQVSCGACFMPTARCTSGRCLLDPP